LPSASSYQAGASALDCVDRALAAAVGFTLAGRWLLGWLEPPELRMLKMRQRRDARRSKKGNGEAGGSTGRGRQAAPTMSKSA